MKHLHKSILLCDLSDEKVEKVRAQFLNLLGLSEEEYKAITVDYSHLIKNNAFFEENKKVILVCALSERTAIKEQLENLLI